MSTVGKPLVVWVAALVACVCGLFPVSALGLSVPGSAVVPLAMCSGALLAALAATWVGSPLLVEKGSRSRLLPVVGVTEVAAVVLAGILLAVVQLRIPLIAPLLASGVIIAVTATFAARRLRTSHVHVKRDVGVSLTLVAVGVLVVAGGVPVLCATALSCTP